MKYFNIAIIAFGFIIAIVLIKYKPIYKVSVSGEELGYVENKEALEESVKQSVIEAKSDNVDSIEIKQNPAYELKLVDRTQETNEEEIANKIEENVVVTYKYYEIALENNTIETVNTEEEAKEVIEHIKENQEQELDLSFYEKFTENEEEVNTTELEVAKTNAQTKVQEQLEEEQKAKEEEERINAMPDVNGIKFAIAPVSGTITSRYGVSSKIRSSDHTGLDIAAPKGTPIKAAAAGKVTYAGNAGDGYGNYVVISHGNGVQTVYAHCSKLLVSKGQQVSQGEVIAKVGSTGNSTGNHLHLEVRKNGIAYNPQNYVY